MSAEEARAEALTEFMESWYDRWAGPGESWTLRDMAEGIVEWQASREVTDARAETIANLLSHARARRDECREPVVVSGCHIRREPYGDTYWSEVMTWLEGEHAAALVAAREVRS
jgi:hypothetical protein